jgi:hypothetical protein
LELQHQEKRMNHQRQLRIDADEASNKLKLGYKAAELNASNQRALDLKKQEFESKMKQQVIFERAKLFTKLHDCGVDVTLCSEVIKSLFR